MKHIDMIVHADRIPLKGETIKGNGLESAGRERCKSGGGHGETGSGCVYVRLRGR